MVFGQPNLKILFSDANWDEAAVLVTPFLQREKLPQFSLPAGALIAIRATAVLSIGRSAGPYWSYIITVTIVIHVKTRANTQHFSGWKQAWPLIVDRSRKLLWEIEKKMHVFCWFDFFKFYVFLRCSRLKVLTFDDDDVWEENIICVEILACCNSIF